MNSPNSSSHTFECFSFYTLFYFSLILKYHCLFLSFSQQRNSLLIKSIDHFFVDNLTRKSTVLPPKPKEIVNVVLFSVKCRIEVPFTIDSTLVCLSLIFEKLINIMCVKRPIVVNEDMNGKIFYTLSSFFHPPF